MIRVFVTGAGGCVGSMLTRYLSDSGQSITALLFDRNEEDRISDLPGIDIVYGDIRDRERMEGILSSRQFDVIIHLAAVVHNSRAKEDLYFHANYQATVELFDLAEKHRIKQFVFMSTVAVYGDCTSGVLDEESVTNPQTLYAVSKLKAEEYLLKNCGSSVKPTIIRCTTVYGKYDRGNIDRLFRMAKRGIVPIPGDGSNLKSLIYVENLVQGIACMLLNPAAFNQIFILRDEEIYSVDRIVRDMETIANKRVWLIHLPADGLLRFLNRVSQVLGPIPGVNIIRAVTKKLTSKAAFDNKKATSMLSFVPPYSLLEGLKRTYGG